MLLQRWANVLLLVTLPGRCESFSQNQRPVVRQGQYSGVPVKISNRPSSISTGGGPQSRWFPMRQSVSREADLLQQDVPAWVGAKGAKIEVPLEPGEKRVARRERLVEQHECCVRLTTPGAEPSAVHGTLRLAPVLEIGGGRR